ncbi:MAG: ArnT family glycosyltransferase [Candidatus Glassbacteria bacterium]
MRIPILGEEEPGRGRWALYIASSAFILRVITLTIIDPSITSDSLIYHKLARSILETGSFALDGNLTAYRPAGYPFFLACVYSLPGSDVIALRIIQALIDALSCLIVFRMGRSIFNLREGLLAAALLSVFIPYVLYSQALLSETLFTFLLLSCLQAISAESDRKTRLVTAGFTLGLCTYIKPIMALFPAAILVSDLSTGRPLKNSLKRLFVLALVMGLTASPWFIRNRAVFGEWVFTTNGGINFWIGNNPLATGAYKVPGRSDIFEAGDEITRNRLALREATDFLTAHPLQALKIVPWKFFFLFSSESVIILNFFEEPGSQPVAGRRFAERYLSVPAPALILVNLPYYLLLLLSLPSLILEKRKDRRRSLPTVTLIFWVGIHLAFFGSNRFHMPMMSLLSIFAARTLSSLRLLIDGTSAFRVAALILSFALFVFLWIGEWIGLLLKI